MTSAAGGTPVERCNYPECRCPFDMGADNKCLIGRKPRGDFLGYACAYCGHLFQTYNDPSVISCCKEVGHVEPVYEGDEA